MEKIDIAVRNNLNIPIRLTVTNNGRVLITIGNEGVALRDFYQVCIDKDIKPNQEWLKVGSLTINTKSTIAFEGTIP